MRPPVRRLCTLAAVGLIGALLLLLAQPAPPGCRAVRHEVESRVASLFHLHLVGAEVQVRLREDCPQSALTEGLSGRWQRTAHLWGLARRAPLSAEALTSLPTRDLLSTQGWSGQSWSVRARPALDAASKKKLRHLLTRYMGVVKLTVNWQAEHPRSSSPRKRGSSLPPSIPNDAAFADVRSFFAALEVVEARQALGLLVMLLAVTGVALVLARPYRRMQRQFQMPQSTPRSDPRQTLGPGVMFAQAFVEDWRRRVDELYGILLHHHPHDLQTMLRDLAGRDPDSLLWTILNVSAPVRRSLLQQLPVELWMGQEARLAAALERDLAEDTRGLVRFLLELGRELKRLSGWEASPITLHLIHSSEWTRLAADLSRSRRRELAQRLGRPRAAWLRTRNDLHPDWGSNQQQREDVAILVTKVSSLIQLQACQLREQLEGDPEIFEAMNTFFSSLTLDASLNADLAALCQMNWRFRHKTLAARAAAFDASLIEILRSLDQETVALVLFDWDPGLRTRFLEKGPSLPSGVQAHLQFMDTELPAQKQWKTRARHVARYLERQLLIRDVLIKPISEHR